MRTNTSEATRDQQADARGNPKIPCHSCGTEERFMTMKRDPDWTLEYVDEPYWRAWCPDCSPKEEKEDE